jgi:hypothetical protein
VSEWRVPQSIIVHIDAEGSHNLKVMTYVCAVGYMCASLVMSSDPVPNHSQVFAEGSEPLAWSEGYSGIAGIPRVFRVGYPARPF